MVRAISLEPTSQRELESLISLIEMSKGKALAICICNQPILKEAVLESLEGRLNSSDIGLVRLEIERDEKSLVGKISKHAQSDEFRQLLTEFGHVAISVEGVENAVPIGERNEKRAPEAIRLLNQQRDFFLSFQYPVVLWFPEWLASRLPREATDFWRIRTGVFVFKPFEEMRVQYAEQLATMPTFARSVNDIRRRIRILQRLIEGLSDDDEAEARSKALLLVDLGNQFLGASEFQGAEEAFQQVKEITSKLNDKKLMAAAIGSSGIIRALRGDYSEVEQLFKQALEIARGLEDKSDVVITLRQLGGLARVMGRYEEAREFYEESLEIARELGDKSGVAKTLHQLGKLAQDMGDYEEAKRFYEESLEIARELGDRLSTAFTFVQLSLWHAQVKDFKEAVKYSMIAREIFQYLGLHDHGVNPAIQNLLETIKELMDEKELEQAVEEAKREAEEILRQ